jgi:zinc transport system substrate-binding protein
VLTFSLVACSESSNKEHKIGVVVTLLPQAEFVERVGGDRVHVTVMVPPGADPHTYEPTPGQMADFTKAHMYAKVGSGVEFELVFLDRLLVQNQTMMVVDCSDGLQLMEMVEHEHQEHSENEHHSGNDPHVWLSPRNAKIMVENIYQGLVQVDKEGAEYYNKNRDTYLAELDQLDKEIGEGLKSTKNRRFLVFHPAWGYFAKDYNLEQIAIEIGGKEPSAKDITYLVQEAKKHNIKVIFASTQFNPQSAEVIAKEIGGRVVFIDPLVRNYLENMRLVMKELIDGME